MMMFAAHPSAGVALVGTKKSAVSKSVTAAFVPIAVRDKSGNFGRTGNRGER
jgi:hypothetical protein